MIVVGYDGSAESEAALEWALDEARLRKTTVRAVHAWSTPVVATGVGMYASEIADPGPYERAAEQLLGHAAEHHGDRAGDLQTSAVRGLPAEVLVGAAHDAEMLVVGSRGHGGFASLLLGSVSQQCAQHATCPVVIVRASPRAHP